MARFSLHVFGVVFLTLLTQVGGLAWLSALAFRRRVLAFVVFYAAFSVGALWIAPLFGREPIPCNSNGALQLQSSFYCVLNRQYVVPELHTELRNLATEVDSAFPGTKTLVLDANFPFLTGFPLLPHLSHNDGRKVDLAFYYTDEGAYLPGKARSPIGYFAFEEGPTKCPSNTVTLRWDFGWLQGFWPEYVLDVPRTSYALKVLDKNPRIGKILLEPHLKERLLPDSDKTRFQGCRAARHDDHIHLQL